MQFNTSTDYAIRIIFYLAKESKTVSSSKLAAAIGVSARYLLQIGAKLRNASLITATYGPAGGFSLISSPKEISLYDIIIIMESHISNKKIQADREELAEFKILNVAYGYMDTMLNSMLKSITIESLLSQSTERWYLASCLLREDFQ